MRSLHLYFHGTFGGIKVPTEPTSSFEVIDKNLAAEKYIVGKKKNVLNAELKNTGSHSDLEKKVRSCHMYIYGWKYFGHVLSFGNVQMFI